jgi:hypothetical protein
MVSEDLGHQHCPLNTHGQRLVDADGVANLERKEQEGKEGMNK